MRIAIITHEIDVFKGSAYLLHHMSKLWMQRGFDIAIIKGTGQALPDADMAILHVDITAVGDDYGRIIDRYPLVINGRIRDISKTVFSDLLVTRESAYQGPVIVKTNANFGGMRERQARAMAGDHVSDFDIQRPWKRVEWLEEYPVFDSIRDVPAGVWRNDKLIVEKYITEQNEDGEYVLRIWVFFGDREVYYLCYSDEPVIKSHNTLRREFRDPAEVPESLRERRKALGFDLGKFDFSINDGEAVLYDVNRTPGSARHVENQDAVDRLIRMLSEGIDVYTAQLGSGVR